MRKVYVPDNVSYFDDTKLKHNIAIPSSIHGYSLGVEYMTNWFISKFEKDFFKTLYVNGKSVYDDYRKVSKQDLLTIEKPALSIIPSMEYDYNRDNLDLYQAPLHNYFRRSTIIDTCFFKDTDSCNFIDLHLRQMQINFTFRIRVKTRPQQIDLFDYMRMAFRIGSTQSEYMDYDFHVPKDMILSVARDKGFEIDNNGNIKNVIDFVQYLNSHSMLPFMYKYRTINGNNEFFIRYPHLYTHISCLDNLSLDDGERQGQLDNNFHIDMNCILKIPVPHYYAYFTNHTIKKEKEIRREFIGLYKFKTLEPPEKNSKGWDSYILTEYVSDEKYVDTIEFGELIQNNDIMKVIEYTKSLFISPSVFMDFIVYNEQKEIPVSVDWENFKLNIRNESRDLYYKIGIYVDVKYANEQLVTISKLDTSDERQKKSDRQ